MNFKLFWYKLINMKGKEIESKMLTGLIPLTWKEIVVEYDNYYACRVLGERLSETEWDKLYSNIESEFGEHLMEVYSYTSNGIDFVVYLRKGKNK